MVAKPMRIVVITGSREWADPAPIRAALDGADLVVHGAARGADLIAEAQAKQLEIAYLGVPAKWRAQGRREAGMHRNTRLVRLARRYIDAGHEVVCHAFPLPSSRGTWDCVRKMRAAGVPVTIHEPR